MKCPCGSNKRYPQCCKIYHDGRPAPDPLTLMRSRYSAYARGHADYIIATTHPDNPNYTTDPASILAFCHTTRFDKLTIVDATNDTVTFTAHLSQGGQDATFTETSLFKKVDDRWLYHSGTISKP